MKAAETAFVSNLQFCISSFHTYRLPSPAAIAGSMSVRQEAMLFKKQWHISCINLGT
ncbi:MAG: hypothetical protein U1F76_11205 [Candidatus Competibacteraceae bacterium]